MKDHTKINLLLTVAYLPVFSILFYLIMTSFVPIRILSLVEFWAMMMLLVFAVLMTFLHPRSKHWFKALREFEENYVYEKEAE